MDLERTVVLLGLGSGAALLCVDRWAVSADWGTTCTLTSGSRDMVGP
jgi:hypothetical protein